MLTNSIYNEVILTVMGNASLRPMKTQNQYKKLTTIMLTATLRQQYKGNYLAKRDEFQQCYKPVGKEKEQEKENHYK